MRHGNSASRAMEEFLTIRANDADRDLRQRPRRGLLDERTERLLGHSRYCVTRDPAWSPVSTIIG